MKKTLTQKEVKNYVKECFQRFEKKFLEDLKKIELEKHNKQNYSNLFENADTINRINNAPEETFLLFQYENKQMDFATKAFLSTMTLDYNKMCNELVLKNDNQDKYE